VNIVPRISIADPRLIPPPDPSLDGRNAIMTDIKRPHYFNSQLLAENDFNDEQAYHLASRRRNNRVSRTSGVADGLAVTRISSHQVQVAPGMAIDKDGREIVLDAPVTYTVASQASGGSVYLTIAYQDVSDPADESHDQPGKFTRITERPLVQESVAVPPADGSVITLARIPGQAARVLRGGRTQLEREVPGVGVGQADDERRKGRGEVAGVRGRTGGIHHQIEHVLVRFQALNIGAHQIVELRRNQRTPLDTPGQAQRVGEQ
jgi:hypothetical protein